MKNDHIFIPRESKHNRQIKMHMRFKHLPDFLKITEVAELLRISKLTLKRWEKKGLVKPIKINSRGDRLYRKQEILKLAGAEEESREEVQDE